MSRPPGAYNLLKSRPVQDLGSSKCEGFAEFLAGLPARVEEAVLSL